MATCYHITEQVGRTMVPCNHTAVAEGKQTNCCTENYLCLSNGMCRAPKLSSASNYYWRIGCTDKTFSDPACGKYCTQVPFNQADDNWKQLIWQCPGTGSYCCNTGKQTLYEERVGRTNTSCCDIKDLTFNAVDPFVVATASSIPQSFSIGGSFTQPPPANTRSTASSSALPSSLVEGAKPSNSVTSTSLALPIGLGVGLGAGVVILVGILLVCIRKRKNKQGENDARCKSPLAELMATSPSEMMVVERPVELASPIENSSNTQ